MASTPANERSRASTISTPQHQPPANLNKEDLEDWHAIDRALSHINSVNPSHPYVLTIPQDVEPRYHHTHQVQARQWLDRTPFTDREHEASQYLTWHFHEPSEIYTLHSTRPREEREDASSRVGTPKIGSGGAKKTMSLGAYKKKVAGGTPGPDERKKAEVNGEKKEETEGEKLSDEEKAAKKPAVKGPVERLKADAEVLAAVEDSDEGLSLRADSKKDDGKKDLKRKREEEDNDGEAVKRKREDSKLSDAPEKTRVEEKDTRKATKAKPAGNGQRIAPLDASSISKDADPASNAASEQLAAKKAKTSPSKDGLSQPTKIKSAKEEVPKQDMRGKPDKRDSPPPKPSKENKEMALPPRLSPLRQDKDKGSGEDTAFLLPPRLSPTLPANITATLAARKHHRSTSKSSANGDNLSPPRKALENGVVRRKSPVNGYRANSSSPMTRSDAEDGRGRSKMSAPQVRSPSPSGEDSEIPVGRTAATAKTERKPKLMVKLKFKQRSTRESVKQLLKLPSAKKKPEQPKTSPTTLKATDARHREQRDANAKGVAQRIGPATKGVAKKVEKSATSTPIPAEKRAREEESEADGRATKRKKADIAVYEPPAKRKKSTPEALDLKKHPATPAQATQHPATPASSAPKPSSQTTPSAAGPKKAGKELLAAATTSASMKRETSHDSQGQVPTPSASSSSPAASSVSQQQASIVPKSTPATSSTPASSQIKTPRQKEWDNQSRIYNDLGRELKHAAAADISTASESKKKNTSDKPTDIQKLAAIKTLESFLAFFLAFTANDEASLAADPRIRPRTSQWRSLEQYLPFVKRNTEPFPALQGLACSLAVVFCAKVAELCVETNASPEILTQTWMLLSRSAAEAEGKLDGRTLQEIFPKTWAEAAKGGWEEKDKLEPGKFAGAFRLTLGVQTKPVRAVRAAERVLREWIEREGLEYQMRLKLE